MSIFSRKNSETGVEARDLSETRRLLYMLLFVNPESETSRHDLGGTLTNALVHHQLHLDVDEVMDHLRAMLYEDPQPPASVEWVHGCISAVTAMLEGLENGPIR